MSKLGKFAAACAAVVTGGFSAFALPHWQCEMTVGGYAGSTELTDFPLLVKISPERVTGFSYADCAAGGVDISFTDAMGNPLSHEVDTWNPDGTSFVWVKLPKLSGKATKIVFHWNDIAPVAKDPTDVWNGYVGVWHLGEQALDGYADSTGHGLTATNAVSATIVETCTARAGMVGDGRWQPKLALRIPSYDDQKVGGVFTIGGWYYLDERTGYESFFNRKATYNAGDGFQSNMQNADTTICICANATSAKTSGYTFSKSVKARWIHYVVVYDGSKVRLYENGAKRGSDWDVGANVVKDNGRELVVGGAVKGMVDEFRLRKSAVSADWIKAEYDQVASDAFVTAGESSFVASSAIGVRSTIGEYGEVTPGYGVIDTPEAGSEYVFACTRDSVVLQEDAEHVICRGWKLYDAESGTLLRSSDDTGEEKLVCRHTYEQDKGVWLEWQWVREYVVDAVATGGGSVSAEKTWVPDGDTLTLTATPDEGCTFQHWAHKVTGEVLATEPALELAVSAPRQVEAFFLSPGHIAWSASVSDYTPIIRAAVTDAAAGAVIALDEGIYPLASTLVVDKAITLQGAESGGTVLKASKEGYYILGVSGGATIERLTVTGGSKTSGWQYYGIGVNITAGTLSQCVITNNSYSGSGNACGVGVYANVGDNKTVTITRCRICDNLGASSNNTMPGVGLYVSGKGTFRMDNCLVTGNTSTKGNDSSTWAGGGMFISHSDAQIVNCTFADNHHNNRGGGVNVGGGTPKFYNCIIARNAVDTRDPCIYKPDVSASTLTDGAISSTITGGFHNTLVSYGVPTIGTDGLAADPLFADGGYQLKIGSPAIGAGTAVAGITDGIDLDGTARDPSSVDLGCFRYVPSVEFSVKVDVGATAAFNDDPVPVTVTYFNVPEGKTLVNHYYAVSATETNALECVDGKVVIARPGTWNVRVVVTDDEGVLASEDSPTTVKVGVHKAYVTSRADATPEFPYVTSETAATCLNDVTEYCIDGTEIELDAGSHTIRARNDFTAAVRLHGAGRDLTWINGNKKSAFYVNNSGFVMENLSVTNFNRTNGGAVELSVEGGTVRNCRFAKNELHWAGSNCSGMTILASGAKTSIENCVFEDLSYTAGDNGCVGIAICLNGGTARNCLFANIRTDSTRGTETSIVSVGSGATLENCTFADCSVKYYKNGDNAVNTVYLISTAGTVRNVLCRALEEVHAESEPVPPWAYLRGTAASAVRNCCFEGETKYGIDGADGTKINFKANEPYHLRVMSSCRNAGQTQEWMTGATDLDGNPRVHGKAVDIGCYECQEGPGLMLLVK